MPQTSYTTNPVAALEGMREPNFGDVLLSRNLQDAAGVGFGRLIAQHATVANGAAALAASGDIVKALGFTVRTQLKTTRTPAYAQYDEVAMLRRGRIWLTVIDDTASMVVPYVVYSGANAGLIQTASAGATQIEGIKVLVGALAGNLALVEVNLPA